MLVDFTGTVDGIDNLEPGSFFVSRTNGQVLLGLRAVHGGSPGGVLFNLAPKGMLYPSLVTSRFFGGQGLVALPAAVLVPHLSEFALDYSSDVADGPGMLTLFADQAFMRVARLNEGFYYVNVGSGEVTGNRPAGVEIPRWSIRLSSAAPIAEALFVFNAPRPITN